jgi:hypothetical protein
MVSIAFELPLRFFLQMIGGGQSTFIWKVWPVYISLKLA